MFIYHILYLSARTQTEDHAKSLSPVLPAPAIVSLQSASVWAQGRDQLLLSVESSRNLSRWWVRSLEGGHREWEGGGGVGGSRREWDHCWTVDLAWILAGRGDTAPPPPPTLTHPPSPKHNALKMVVCQPGGKSDNIPVPWGERVTVTTTWALGGKFVFMDILKWIHCARCVYH